MHIIQRGHNRQLCFTSEAELAAYAHWLKEGAEKFSVRIHGWVLMTNHVHLLMTPEADNAISKLMQFLGRLYVRQFNYRHSRSGSLFEDRFKSSLIEDEQYLITCLRYIELNPVRAGMVVDPGDYKWSSYRAHALGKLPNMWSPHKCYLAIGGTPSERQRRYRKLISQQLSTDAISMIRNCANKGLILGTDQFRAQFREITGDTV